MVCPCNCKNLITKSLIVFQDDIVSFFWGAERTKGLYSVRWGDCFLTHLLHLRSCMHKAYRKILDVHIRRSSGGCGLIFCSVLQFISKYTSAMCIVSTPAGVCSPFGVCCFCRCLVEILKHGLNVTTKLWCEKVVVVNLSNLLGETDVPGICSPLSQDSFPDMHRLLEMQ